MFENWNNGEIVSENVFIGRLFLASAIGFRMS